MKHQCPDDLMLAAYLEGTQSSEFNENIVKIMNECNECRVRIAELSRVVSMVDDNDASTVSVPTSITQRALSLFDQAFEKRSILTIAAALFTDGLKSLSEGIAPLSMSPTMLRGAAIEDELNYQIKLGKIGLDIQLLGANDDEVDLMVTPHGQLEDGWRIVVYKDEQVRSIAKLGGQSVAVSSLPAGIYRIALDKAGEEPHEFHLRLVGSSDE